MKLTETESVLCDDPEARFGRCVELIRKNQSNPATSPEMVDKTHVDLDIAGGQDSSELETGGEVKNLHILILEAVAKEYRISPSDLDRGYDELKAAAAAHAPKVRL